jgi:hypothetical protein
MHNVLGGTIDPHAAYLMLRGMKTLDVRVQRQNQVSLAHLHDACHLASLLCTFEYLGYLCSTKRLSSSHISTRSEKDNFLCGSFPRLPLQFGASRLTVLWLLCRQQWSWRGV